MTASPPVQLVVEAGPLLSEIARRDAGSALLRFETVDDLVLGMQQEALRALPGFVWQGDAAFRGWIAQVARRYLSGRRDHWFALKRAGGAVLRLTRSWGEGASGVAESTLPARSAPGPRTFAQNREDLATIIRAMDLLPPRDRDLVAWAAEGVPAIEQAARLHLSPDALRKASDRALERLRKLVVVVTRVGN